jgi:hypothetical protein
MHLTILHIRNGAKKKHFVKKGIGTLLPLVPDYTSEATLWA